MIITGDIFGTTIENFLRLQGIPISRSDLSGWSGYGLNQLLPCVYYTNGFVSSVNFLEDAKSLEVFNNYLDEVDNLNNNYRFFVVPYDLIQKLKTT